MPDYDTSASPPALLAQMELWTQDGEPYVAVPMLLNSGSDVTIVPLSAAQAVRATLRPYSIPLLAYDGERVYRDRARLIMRLLRYTFGGDYLVDDVAVGVLGRNVLNALVVILDGPRLIWSAHAP